MSYGVFSNEKASIISREKDEKSRHVRVTSS